MIPPSLRAIVPLAIGLATGVAGAVLFLQSMPPAEGSAAERAAKLEVELKHANNRLAAFEAADPHGRRKPGQSFKDRAGRIVEDLRDGKPVSPDDIFHAMQPFIRDFSPLFDRIRVRQMEKESDALAGEMARKYGLNPKQQEALQAWLKERAAEESKRYFDTVSQEGIKLEDLASAAQDVRIDDGIESFMEKTIAGDKLAAFKADRMTEKVARVQSDADMRVERLDDIVDLDDQQRGQLFGVMARGSRDYDPAMQFEGLGEDHPALTSGMSKQQAVFAVLRPEQRTAYEEAKKQQAEQARKDMADLGLTVPDNWTAPDPLDN